MNTIRNDGVAPKDPEQNDIAQFTEPPKKITFDDFLVRHLGNFGRYQFIQYILLCIPNLFVAMHVMSWTFVGLTSEVICDNSTIMENCTTTRYSAVDRWPVVEEQSWIKGVVQAFYYVGHMVGSIICGVMSDRVGRKRMFYLAIVIEVISGILLTVAPTWWLYAILKFGTGFTHPGLYAIAIVIGTELVGPNYRKIVAVGTATSIAIGEMILVGLAYLITDYRLLHAVIALPSLLLLVYWWLVPESMRWLVTKERYEEANAIMQKAARINRTSVPDKWWEQLEKKHKTKDISYGIVDLFRTRRLRIRTLVCFFAWPVNAMIYYGLTMKSDIAGGDLYINFTISAAIEIPAILLVYFFIDRVGRRAMVAGSFLIAGICLLLNWLIGDNVALVWGMLQIVITKGAATVAFIAIYTFTAELFPTVIRTTAVGCCSMIARFGAVISSFLALWLVEAQGRLSMVIPLAVLSLIAAVLMAVLLPETVNKPMPETISDVEATRI
ncbi:hypothetical protein RB195_016903 [Necator americanus]